MERNHDPVIEFGLLGPGQSETRPLPIDDQRGRERHVNLRFDPDLRRAEAPEVAGRVGRATNGQRRHARGTVRRDDDRQWGIDG